MQIKKEFANPRLQEAYEFAAMAHGDQKRKLPPHKPYIVHPLEVAKILEAAGCDAETIIAGLLHDVVEDTEYTSKDVQERFGGRVAEIVLGVTEDKSMPYVEMKEKYLNNLAAAPDECKWVSGADLLSNRGSVLMLLRNGQNAWQYFSKHPRRYAFFTLERDRRRLAIIKTAAHKDFMAELAAVCEETEKITKQIIPDFGSQPED